MVNEILQSAENVSKLFGLLDKHKTIFMLVYSSSLEQVIHVALFFHQKEKYVIVVRDMYIDDFLERNQEVEEFRYICLA